MRASRLLFVCCMVLGWIRPAATAEAVPPLLFLLDSSGQPPASRAVVPDAAEEFVIDLDPATVAANPRILMIELPGHAPLEAVRQRFVEYRPDWKSWSGVLREPGAHGKEAGTLRLGYHGDRLTAFLDVEGERYRIVGSPGGSHTLVRLAPELGSPPCGLDEAEDPIHARFEAFDLGPETAPVLQTAAVTGPVQLDLLALYPKDVFTLSASAEANYLDYIEYTIDEANQIFENSGVDVSYNLVGVVPVLTTDDKVYPLLKDGTQDGINWLNGNPQNNLPVPPEVVALRDAFGADMVALFIPNNWASPTQAQCGIGNLPEADGGIERAPGPFGDRAFTSIRVNCGAGDLTVAHELGHNFGMRHDDDVDDPNDLFSYGKGFLFNNNTQATLMGCICGNSPKPACTSTNNVCGRVPYLSSTTIPPTLGMAVGDASHDNARVARERAPVYANFRQPSSNTPPTAIITVSCTGLTCSFSAASSTDDDALPTTSSNYYWDFGDNTTGTGRTPTRTYNSGGSRRVHLVLTDRGGQRDATAVTVNPWVPVYEGYLETANCRGISGWAWDQLLPNDPIKVDVYRDSTRATTASGLSANLFRQDLLNAGKGNGYHGFNHVPSSLWSDGKWHTVSVRYNGTSTHLSGSPAPQQVICHVGIFNAQTPGTYLDTGGSSWSVGNVFSSSIDGYVTHLRYYKAAEEAGVHTLKLWAENSQQTLGQADVDFGAAGTAGWKTGKLSGNGVQITAGTRYVVTVTTFTKQSKTDCGFSNPLTNGPITAHGGRYGQGNGIFPGTNSCSNFWTDIYFDK